MAGSEKGPEKIIIPAQDEDPGLVPDRSLCTMLTHDNLCFGIDCFTCGFYEPEMKRRRQLPLQEHWDPNTGKRLSGIVVGRK